MTVDASYGEGLLAEALDRVAPYVLVTDPVPERLYRSQLSPPPAQTLTPASLERHELDALVPSIEDSHRVVGLGGGSVMDAAKYLSYRCGVDCVLAPTITSTNAPFSDFVSVRDEGTPVGMRIPKATHRVVVDVALLRQADARMNRAGLGDLLAMGTALADAEWAAGHGRGPAIDHDVAGATRALVKRCRRVSPEVGAGSDTGLLAIMEMFADATTLIEQAPALGAGSEHLFAWNAERVTGRHFLHGELVALGTVVGTFLHGLDVESLRSILTAARVVWHPTRLDISRDELIRILRTTARYNREVRRIPAIVDIAEWTDREFDALYRELEP